MKETAEPKATRVNDVRRMMVQEIEKGLKAPYLFVTQYKGLSVKDLEELRQRLRPAESHYLVAKNTLSHLALKSLGCEGLVTTVSGQTGFVVGPSDPIGISKILVAYVKDHEALKLCGGVVDGEILTAERIREFAKLPSRDVLIGKAVYLIKSPLSGLAGVLAGTVQKLLYALQEISKKKGKEGS